MADALLAPAPPGPPGRRWSRSRVVTGIGVLVVVLALLVYLLGGRPRPVAGHRADHRADHEPSVARHGLDAARLDVAGGVDRLTIISADLGGDLVRAETPSGERAVPVLRQAGSGAVSVTTAGSNSSGNGTVDLTIRLSRDVRWSIAVDSGTQLLTLDLAGARLQAVQVDVGVSTIDAELPRPDGALVLRVSGGAGAVRVREPAGVPTRVTFAGGGGGATLDGVRHAGGLPGGAVLTTPDWPATASAASAAPNRTDVALDSGVSTFDLDRTG